MFDPVTYSFYGTTVPLLLNINASAINTLRTAKHEQAKFSRPSDQAILDSNFGDMLPFRKQPLLMAKFSLAPLEYFKLSKIESPALTNDYKTLDEVIEFFEGVQKVFESIDEKDYNEAAEKSCEIFVAPSMPPLHVAGFADYCHGFVIPNSYFHLNTMYMLLRNAGFQLGKAVYVDPFKSEQQLKDWAALNH